MSARPFLAPGEKPSAQPPRFPSKPPPGRPPRRRSLLGAVAALAAVPGPVLAAPSPDAALLAACARYLQLQTVLNDPAHPNHDDGADERPEFPEFDGLEDMLTEAVPQTAEGWQALAGIALLHDASIEDMAWNEHAGMVIARRVLRHLAGPEVAREEACRSEERARREEETWLRLREIEASRPKLETAPPPSPKRRIEDARWMIAFAEKVIREAEAVLAAKAA